MIVLGVQQGISSLPPTSGQSFRYDYDASIGQAVPTEEIGPGAFRSARTMAKGAVSLRVAASYFELSDRYGPVDHLIEFQGEETFVGVAGFGLDASAKVFLVNLGASAGLTDKLEVMFNVPLSVVDAEAFQISSVFAEDLDLPPDQVQAAGFFGPGPLPSDPAARAAEVDFLQQGFRDSLVPPNGPCRTGCLDYRRDSFESLGFGLNNGTEVGVGRINVGGKYMLVSEDYVQLALSGEFFFASADEDEFAGSDSYSILPRLIAEIPLAIRNVPVRLHFDVGYEHDFSEAELRRVVWNSGVSLPIRNFAFDLGVGGSRFDTAIRFTPPQAKGIAPDGSLVDVTALADTGIGVDFVDFVGGVKVKVFENLFLNGIVNVPLTDDGFRADAVGTVALEYYL
jgi:hypothetical protein